MKKFITLILFISILLLSCSDNDEEVIAHSQTELQNACTAEDPLELEWMQGLIADIECGKYSCKISILENSYKGETVFTYK